MLPEGRRDKRADGVLLSSVQAKCGTDSEGTRVLVHGTGRLNASGILFQRRSPVIVYSPASIPRKTLAALEGMSHVKVHLHPQGSWPLGEMLRHLRATYAMRRVAFGGSLGLFRALAAEDLLDEVTITWRPRIVGGLSTPTMTGLGRDFLPRGIELFLLKLEKAGDECLATYRVQGHGR